MNDFQIQIGCLSLIVPAILFYILIVGFWWLSVVENSEWLWISYCSACSVSMPVGDHEFLLPMSFRLPWRLKIPNGCEFLIALLVLFQCLMVIMNFSWWHADLRLPEFCLVLEISFLILSLFCGLVFLLVFWSGFIVLTFCSLMVLLGCSFCYL